MTQVLVQDSPSKGPRVTQHIQQGLERQRHSALYGNPSSASTSTIREPALPQAPKSSFLASSASAHRTAASLNRKSDKNSQHKTFKRNAESSLEGSSRAPLANAAPGVERDDALRLIETLPIGPKQVTPPDDDPHFLRYEPTSGIALRQRKMPHQEVVSHLEGRYYIPISTLYSIAVPGPSDDGDFSIPVEGDWLTMGVIVKRSEVFQTRGVTIGCNGRRFDTEDLGIEDHDTSAFGPAKKDTSKDVEPSKTLHPRNFIIFTLLDISSPPDKFGQHDGSQEIELAVFESESSTVVAGGERVYHGGSCGAYEKMVMASYGTLICILNPRVKKQYTGKRNAMTLPRDEYFKQKEDPNRRPSTKYRLNARNGKMVALIGVASDYGQCTEEGCKDMVDRRTKMDKCAFHFNRRLQNTQNGRPQLQSSWRPSKPSNQYSMSDGMAGPKAKQYLVESETGDDPTMPGGKLFDLSMLMGRGAEMRAAEEKKERERISKGDQENEVISRLRDTAVDARLESMALAKIRKAQEELAERQGGGRKSILSGVDVMAQSAGSKVIEASLKAVQERKRQAEAELNCKSSKGARRKVARQDKNIDVQPKGASIATGSYRASNGDVKVLSDISSKLLSRHSVKSSDLVKSALLLGRRKKARLPPTVRPPPGESFYAEESSDEEINALMESEAMNQHLSELDKHALPNGSALSSSQDNCRESDSDSDLEIVPS